MTSTNSMASMFPVIRSVVAMLSLLIIPGISSFVPAPTFANPSLKCRKSNRLGPPTWASGGAAAPTRTDGARLSSRPFRLYSSEQTAAAGDDVASMAASSSPPRGENIVVNGAKYADATFPPSPSTSPKSLFSIPGWTTTKTAAAMTSRITDTIRKASNIASFLCVLDCTILPIVTVVLPLLGVLNIGATQLDQLHRLGHSLAIWFVLPVGSLTTVINYQSHKKRAIATLACVGLLLVGLANTHVHVGSMALSLQILDRLLHGMQHGPWHQVTNVAGCAMLLGSNYLSQKQGCAHHDHHGPSSQCSSHDHGHDHDNLK